MSRLKQQGMTLIELVVAVCIVGILSAIAYPIYTNAIMKSNRTDAKTEIMDYAQRLQRCYSGNGTYNTANGVCQVKDALMGASGLTTRGGLYVVKLTAVAAANFTLTATPVAGGRQAGDDDCRTFTLDQAGLKKAYKTAGDENTSCW